MYHRPGFRAGVAQLAERHLPKVDVASSNLVSRSIVLTVRRAYAWGGRIGH